MKTLCIVFVFIVIGFGAKAQQAVVTAPSASIMDTTLSHRIAQKLTDSLQLSTTQALQISRISLWIDSSKRAIITNWHNTPTFNVLMGQIEYSRDSAYQQILIDQQYVQYGMHKMSWVLNQ